jgi:hypothetical protein
MAEQLLFYDIARPHLAPDALSEPSLDAGHNMVYRSDGGRLRGRASDGDLWGVDPMFVNPAAGDFRLQPTSPGIDAGTRVKVETDYSGGPRPLGGSYDIGAFESVINAVDPPGPLGRNAFVFRLPF